MTIDVPQLRLEVPSAVTDIPDPKSTARHSRCQEPKAMELSDSDRPVSFGSTSSSASSRDSHGSFGSRMTLVSNSHLGLFHQDKEAGAIKLELIPARPLSGSELQRDGPAGPQDADAGGDRQPRAQRRMEPSGATQPGAGSATSPKLLYVDRVVQEILETERTYVQDLKSIVEVRRPFSFGFVLLKFVTQEKQACEVKSKARYQGCVVSQGAEVG